MGLYLLKIVLVAHPTYEKISGVSGIPKFRLLVFLGQPTEYALTPLKPPQSKSKSTEAIAEVDLDLDVLQIQSEKFSTSCRFSLV